MRDILKATTAITGSFVAFDNTASFPPALPNTVNVGMIAQLMNAATAAASGASIYGVTVAEDMGARNVDAEAMLPYYCLIDDIFAGEKQIKAAGAKYLPRFPDETTDEYQARLDVGKFTNIFTDIVENLSVKPFEQEVELIDQKKTGQSDGDGSDKTTTIPPKITEFIENVDGAGNNLSSFAATTFFNGIGYAVDWIFIDYPVVDPDRIKTQADQQSANIKPFWSHVLAKNVLEATTAVVNGNEELIRMRILEPGIPNHVRLFEKNPDGTVLWALFQQLDTNTQTGQRWKIVGSGKITIGVIPLVPFITGRRDGRSFKVKPVMRSAADLQIKLYHQESGLEFAKVMTAYPMLAANGIRPQKGPDGKAVKLKVGPNRVLYSEPDGQGNSGSWDYVAPDSQCLTFLQSDIDKTKNDLRELGRLPLTAQSGNLTVITTAFAAGKSRSAVSAWGLRLKNALEVAIQITCKWLTINDYKPEVNIYDEYDDFTDQGQDQTTLLEARKNKDISRDAFLHEMKRRSILCEEFNAEDDAKKLLDETPSEDDLLPDDGAGAPGAPGKPPVKPQPKPTPKPAPANK